MSGQRFICSICLYLPGGGKEGDILTVINGQMVCLEHAYVVFGQPHANALAKTQIGLERG